MRCTNQPLGRQLARLHTANAPKWKTVAPNVACRRTRHMHRLKCHVALEQDHGGNTQGLLLGAAVGAALGVSLCLTGGAGAAEMVQECTAQQVLEPVAEMIAPAQDCIRSGLEWVVEESLTATNLTESNFASVGPGGLWLSNSPFCQVWDAYCTNLTQRPLFTKMMTGVVGTFLGDLLAQFLGSFTSRGQAQTQKGQLSPAQPQLHFDAVRSLRLVMYSALLGTPFAHLWFSYLDAAIFPEDPTSVVAVLSKMALDQTLMAPLMTIVFFAAMKVLEGEPAGAAEDVKRKLKPTMMANWMVWPLAHVINFALVPPAQRILYVNVVNIAWTAFMSHMASGSQEAEAGKEAGPQQQQQQGGTGKPKLAPPRLSFGAERPRG